MVGVVSQRAVGIEDLDNVASQSSQHERIEPERVGDKPSFHRGAVFGLDRGRQPFDRCDHHTRMLGRDCPLCLSGSYRGEQRAERLAADARARAEIDRTINARLGFGRRKTQHVAQQGAGVSRAQLSGDATLLDFSNESMINYGKASPLGLDAAQEVEQFVTIEPGQVEGGQFVDSISKAVKGMRDWRSDCQCVEHAFDSSGSLSDLSTWISPVNIRGFSAARPPRR